MLAEIFPVFCVGCHKFNDFLCQECAESITLANTQTRPGFEFQVAFQYEQLMAEILSRVKEKHHYGYIKSLAGYLRRSLDLDTQSEVLVPPPTSKSLRKRGFTPSFEFAKQAGFNVTKKLKRTRQTPDQQSLQFKPRQSNLEKAFRLEEPGDYLLFDDVITTGATVREMMRAVTDSGGQVVGVIALCATSAKGAN